jgi:RNA-binding protein 5/10
VLSVFVAKRPELVRSPMYHLSKVANNAMTEYSLGAISEPSGQANIGDSDASLDSTPSQFLLLRGLEPTVSEEMLAKGIAKLYKANVNSGDSSKRPNAKVTSTTATSNFGSQEGSIKRVFIVRNKESDDSWRYGFVEFHSVEVS